MAAEHEGEADCLGNPDCIDPHHNPLCLPWFQLRKMSLRLERLILSIPTSEIVLL